MAGVVVVVVVVMMMMLLPHTAWMMYNKT